MKKQPNYLALFSMGIIFVGTGVVFMASVNEGLGAAFMALGCIFMMISVMNKDKWNKKDQKKKR